MKAIIKIISICILASIMLVSCISKTSIIKRHYNKGYYVAHSKTNDAKVKSINKSPQSKTSESTLSNESNVEQIVVYKEMDPVLLINEKNTRVNHRNVYDHSLTTSRSNSTLKNSSFHFKSASSEVNKASEEAIGNSSSDDDDGLSLFGFIILLVLILWALGFFIGGLGSLIHLLLVVALVLLILWLLRII